jgi:hypothetical protein
VTEEEKRIRLDELDRLEQWIEEWMGKGKQGQEVYFKYRRGRIKNTKGNEDE